MEYITINVTAEHITNGKAKSCEYCPIALALIDAGYTQVRVGAVSLSMKETSIILILPMKVSSFIELFDKTGDNERVVMPFTFELGIPSNN